MNMWQQCLLMLLLISGFLNLISGKSANHFNHLVADTQAATAAADSLNSASTSAAAATAAGRAATVLTYDNEEETWQPMLNNNWIILQAATAAAAEARSQEATHKNSNNAYTNTYPFTQQHQQPQQQRSATSHTRIPRLPIYAYNQSTGNYKTPTTTSTSMGTMTNMKVVEPYVVAIGSGNMRRSNLPTAHILKRHKIAATHDNSNVAAYNNALPKDIISNIIMPHHHNHQYTNKAQMSSHKIQENNSDNDDAAAAAEKNAESNSRSQNIDETNQEIDRNFILNTDDNNINNNKNNNKNNNMFEEKGENLNEILLPLKNTLDTVKLFCDTMKHIISDDDDDDDVDDHDSDNENDNEIEENYGNANEIDNDFKSSPAMTINDLKTSNEVHGRNRYSLMKTSPSTTSLSLSRPFSRLPSTSKESSLSSYVTMRSVGTSRKIKKFKKKFKKFLLPLLIAYKLKFLALTPVLISGLVLLVGATGMAGFFFALFTAVMSLKSNGTSKSIVIKST